jgi:anthranilate phosphoribosyltransferase
MEVQAVPFHTAPKAHALGKRRSTSVSHRNPRFLTAMIKEQLNLLLDQRALTFDQAYDMMSAIMHGQCSDIEISALLVALRMKGETADEVAGCAKAMREMVTPIPVFGLPVIDTCGTGGDHSQTFNISTTAAFVAAGAGAIVAKHGNRAASSKCGSADLLAEIGVNIECSPERVAQCVQSIGIGFLFASHLHPAMKYAIGVRRGLGIRTIFNLLGPLTNPAGARRGVLGVFSREAQDLIANAAKALGAEHMLVVHGLDGLDEISISTPTRVLEVHNGSIHESVISPDQLGIPTAPKQGIIGGDAPYNATITRDVLAGKPGPCRDIVLLNAAAAILAADLAADWPEAVQCAAVTIDSGKAVEKLRALVTESNRPLESPTD